MLSIRPMQLEDIDAVYAIEIEAYKTPWSRGILHDCVLVGYDCRVIEKCDEQGKTLLGYVISRLDGNHCHILNICIADAFQNQGIGKYLLSQILNSWALIEVQSIILEVRPSNKVAIALYESFGFKTEEFKIGYYVDENGEEDALVLRKIL